MSTVSLFRSPQMHYSLLCVEMEIEVLKTQSFRMIIVLYFTGTCYKNVIACKSFFLEQSCLIIFFIFIFLKCVL